jgi:putative Ca2+/H+ antiporter (TMEM165/GDT1 family)
LGVILALTLQTALGVVFGKLLCRYVSKKYIKIGSGIIFLAFGALFFFGAIIGYRL